MWLFLVSVLCLFYSRRCLAIFRSSLAPVVGSLRLLMCFHDFMLRLKPYLYPHCYLLYSVLVDSLGFCYDTSPTCIIILLVRLVIKCLETEKPGTLIYLRSASPELRMACLPSVWVFPLSPRGVHVPIIAGHAVGRHSMQSEWGVIRGLATRQRRGCTPSRSSVL